MIPEPDRVVKAANKAKEGDLTNLEVVQYAYRFFETFRGLVVDLIFSFRERNQSRDFFLKRTAGDAFRVVETELNFIYEVLYTKLSGQEELHGFNVGITFTLLFGALTLDAIAFVMLIFSDWTVVAFRKSPDMSNDKSLISKLLNIMLEFKRRKLIEDPLNSGCLGLPMRVLRHEAIYAGSMPFTEKLRNFIFEELHTKSEMADDLETAKEISSAKGDWVLRVEGCSNLLPYIVDVDYDESILLWHIATELCYSDELDNRTYKHKDKNMYRDFSKLLSEYMLYLLVMQPTMMSAVAGIGQIRFRDTCAEAKKFFRGVKLQGNTVEKQFQACKAILDVNTEVKPITVKGDRSKSVLFDGCMLAKELKKLGENAEGKDKWEVMSKVWVELLSFAASHCRANSHAQQLSKGGQLITVLWLLMAHLGLGDQFQINEGHARAKLIVGK
ncbi:hypothetical protein RJ639_021285 [Escallonia herrerae]|uniref:DUF4220 domain-containing protein n=1 Tax=Escallonia herrerae TaxID=1293975 RepID=A0AA88V661_9ASTE|nr:hypothetical protein RJ639_021285 [Escallonia herrerae]